MTEQQEVYNFIDQRGYRRGWTAQQFVVRQVLKLIEEVAEAALLVSFDDEIMPRATIDAAGSLARAAFDQMPPTAYAAVRDYDELAQELADIQVVVFAMAQALDFDVIQAARDKARLDVRRGVRGA